jgi:hypothetical protein
MIRLEREITVRLARNQAWDHLARVESWPSWAGHISSIHLDPPGTLTPETAGVIRLRGGVRSTFRMRLLEPPDRWLWVGNFLWLSVRYDHVFEEIVPDSTRIRFLVEVEGAGAGSLGRVFRAIYARNLDRAIPNLVREMEALAD